MLVYSSNYNVGVPKRLHNIRIGFFFVFCM